MASHKHCKGCSQTKPVGDFYRDKDNVDRSKTLCKACYSAKGKEYYYSTLDRQRARHRNVIRVGRYGLTTDQYKGMVEDQKGLCAICNRVCRSFSRLSVDHDHHTGQVRKLLCAGCNTGIGKLDESPDLLRSAADYIEKYMPTRPAVLIEEPHPFGYYVSWESI